MITKSTLRPGQKGTKRLLDKYGDRLVCVRYKYDQKQGRRCTTVELLEEESNWLPSAPSETQPAVARPDTQPLGVRVEYWETDLRELVKAAGAIWRPHLRLWEMPYSEVVRLGLESRVVATERGKDYDPG